MARLALVDAALGEPVHNFVAGRSQVSLIFKLSALSLRRFGATPLFPAYQWLQVCAPSGTMMIALPSRDLKIWLLPLFSLHWPSSSAAGATWSAG